MPNDPIAYLLTWTCRGTWLPGDARGWVNRDHNQFGGPRLKPEPRLQSFVDDSLQQEPLALDDRARTMVEEAIREHCAHREWRLYAISVRSNHVHVVVWGASPPERIMQSLKSWATRRLRAEGVTGSRRLPWTTHGSTKYLWTNESLATAVDYVIRRQDLKSSRHGRVEGTP